MGRPFAKAVLERGGRRHILGLNLGWNLKGNIYILEFRVFP